MATLTASPTAEVSRTSSRPCPRCELPTMHGNEGDLCGQCVGDHSKTHLVKALGIVLEVALQSRERNQASNREFVGLGLNEPHDLQAADRNIRRLRAKIKRNAGNFLVD